MPWRAVEPSINVNTESGQLRTEIKNAFVRLDSQLTSVPQTLDAQTGPNNSNTTSETTLYSATLEVGSWPKNTNSISIMASGSFAANANNKTLKVYFGGVAILTFGPFALNNVSWVISGEVIRVGASSQICYISLVTGDATNKTGANVQVTSRDLTQNQTISITGQGSTTGDVALYSCRLLQLT